MKRKKTNNWQKLQDHLRLALWPHKANRHHPHAIRWYGLALLLALVVGVQGVYNFSAGGSVLGVQANIRAENLLAATNAEREKQQLPALQTSEKLAQAASLKAQDMLKYQYWAHVAPSGATPWHWLETTGYNYSYAGENLAKNFSSASATTTAWMASPEHRANVLGEHYRDVGFAVAEGELHGQSTTLIVALYGNETSAAAPLAATSAPVDQPLAPITRLGVAVQSLTPAALGSIVLLLVVAFVAFMAHVYRRKLPKPMQRSWRRHHGLMKSVGLVSACVVVLVLYSGGQI